MENLDFSKSVLLYQKMGVQDIEKLKTILHAEADSSLYSDSEKMQLNSMINSLDASNCNVVLSKIGKKCSLWNVPIEDENMQKSLSKGMDSIKSLFNESVIKKISPKMGYDIDQAIGRENKFDVFKLLVSNLIELNPSNSKQIYKSLHINKEELAADLKGKYPDLTPSQMASLMHNIGKKLELIKNAKDPTEISNGLKSLKILMEHNLDNKRKVGWNEVDLLFANVFEKIDKAKDSQTQVAEKTNQNIKTLSRCISAPEIHPEWCYFLDEARKIFPNASENEIKDVFRELMRASKFELSEVVYAPLSAHATIATLIDTHNLKSAKKIQQSEIESVLAEHLAKVKSHDLNWIDGSLANPAVQSVLQDFLKICQSKLPHATEDEIKAVFKNLLEVAKFEIKEGPYSEKANPHRVQQEFNAGYRESNEVVGTALYIRQEAFKPIDPSLDIPSSSDSEGANIRLGGASQIYASAAQAMNTKTLNPFYANAFHMMKNLDEKNAMYADSRPGFEASKTEASLWSGGTAVSIYASEKSPEKYRVLEKSNLGKLFDSFEQYPDWKVQYPLWNYLSAGFVNAEIDRQVRADVNPVVFNYNFRTLDPTTVGNLVELTTAMHTLVSDGNKERELKFTLYPLYTDSTSTGGFRRAESIPIRVKSDSNFESMFQDAATKFNEHMQRLIARELEIKDSLKPAVDSLKDGIVPTLEEIKAELKSLKKRDSDILLPGELDALKEKLAFKIVLEDALQKDPNLKKEWQLILDNSFAMGEIKIDPEKIAGAKKFAKSLSEKSLNRKSSI